MTSLLRMLIVGLFVPFVRCSSSAQDTTTIPRDASFTVFSALQKVRTTHPHAVLVSPARPSSVTIRRDLPYATYGTRTLCLDLFLPAGRGNRPAVVMLFGGGWSSGNRSQNEPIAERLAENGIIAASIEYRLSPETLYPAAIHDVKASVRWLRANAAAFGIDTTRIAVLGFSAGGHLAALTGATNGIERFDGHGGNDAYASLVQAVVDIDGVLDLTTPTESGKDTIPGKPSAAAKWLGTPMRFDPEKWKDASPIQHVGPTAPPYLFINSALPRYHAGRDSFIAVLSRYGISSEVRTLPETPHPFLFFHPWFEPTCDYILDFFANVFHRKR